MGRISALTEVTELASNDYFIVLDSSANIAKKVSVQNALGIPEFGWVSSGESWTYASWDSTRRYGTITVPTDATTKYFKGMRVKITQSTGGTKYGIITKVEATLLTVHFPSGVTLNNEAISTPFYSAEKAPSGFPLERTAWEFTYLLTSTTQQTSPNASTWYNTATSKIDLGPGDWHCEGRPAFQMTSGATEFKTALSTSNNSVSHFGRAYIRDYQTSRATPTLNSHLHILDINLTSNGAIYIIYQASATFDARGDTSGGHQQSIVAVTNYL